MTTKRYNMAVGGASWEGWHFGQYGKAREWRLFSPDGEHFQAAEIMELRRLRLDVDYLRMRVTELSCEDGAGITFTPADLSTLRAAVSILDRSLPRARVRPGLPRVRLVSG